MIRIWSPSETEPEHFDSALSQFALAGKHQRGSTEVSFHILCTRRHVGNCRFKIQWGSSNLSLTTLLYYLIPLILIPILYFKMSVINKNIIIKGTETYLHCSQLILQNEWDVELKAGHNSLSSLFNWNERTANDWEGKKAIPLWGLPVFLLTYKIRRPIVVALIKITLLENILQWTTFFVEVCRDFISILTKANLITKALSSSNDITSDV